MQVLTKNRYQKTFRSFKRLTAKGCTPATSVLSSTTENTSTTATTTAEPTNPCMPGNCCMPGTAVTFEEELTEYFRDATDCKDCLDATTADVSPWPQLPQCVTTFPNLKKVAELALSTDRLLGNSRRTGVTDWTNVDVRCATAMSAAASTMQSSWT